MATIRFILNGTRASLVAQFLYKKIVFAVDLEFLNLIGTYRFVIAVCQMALMFAALLRATLVLKPTVAEVLNAAQARLLPKVMNARALGTLGATFLVLETAARVLPITIANLELVKVADAAIQRELRLAAPRAVILAIALNVETAFDSKDHSVLMNVAAVRVA